jgi:GTP-binding protein
MQINSATFISSYADVKKCPPPDKPEFAFIGRSNVGKSSLINMLTGRKSLAKTSVKPGKTQTINHFLINEAWYLVDLPGYGYASVSKSLKEGFGKMIEQYVQTRENLTCLFVLIDPRVEPQKNDLSFINWAGAQGVPLAIIYTKADKLRKNELQKNIAQFERTMYQEWEALPPMMTTSSEKRNGREDVLDFIENALKTEPS